MGNERILITGGSGFIGTNLIEYLIKEGANFINIDKNNPFINEHFKYWKNINILNIEELENIFKDYCPTIVIHLAARTDTFGKKLDEYIDNTKGTENVLEAIMQQNSVKRVVITSTQYVFYPKNYALPKSDIDYYSHTSYGDSKIITEQLTRSANLDSCWTIIRPTNVWGPWHIRYANELIKMIKQQKYFHPGNQKVIKSYAYVKNVVHQIIGIISAEVSIVDKETYYVGDNPINSYEWVNSFSKNLINKNIKIFPRFIIKTAALSGDIFGLLGIKFPLNSMRYKNMTNDYLAPMQKTIDIFGLYSDSLDNNIKETICWLKGKGKKYIETNF